MRVAVFPNTLTSDQIEGWLARGLTVELDRATVEASLLTPRPVRLPVYEGERPQGVLEGRAKTEENALVIEGVLQEEAVRAAVSWEEVARQFDLADTPLYLWRARRLPEAEWEEWRADLDRLGLADKAVLLGGLEGGPLCRAEPTQENAWACLAVRKPGSPRPGNAAGGP